VVDHKPLEELNKHLDLKQDHWDDLNGHFAKNPIRPNVDLGGASLEEEKVITDSKRSNNLKVPKLFQEKKKDGEISEFDVKGWVNLSYKIAQEIRLGFKEIRGLFKFVTRMKKEDEPKKKPLVVLKENFNKTHDFKPNSTPLNPKQKHTEAEWGDILGELKDVFKELIESFDHAKNLQKEPEEIVIDNSDVANNPLTAIDDNTSVAIEEKSPNTNLSKNITPSDIQKEIPIEQVTSITKLLEELIEIGSTIVENTKKEQGKTLLSSVSDSLMKGIDTALGTASETVGQHLGESMGREFLPIMKESGISLLKNAREIKKVNQGRKGDDPKDLIEKIPDQAFSFLEKTLENVDLNKSEDSLLSENENSRVPTLLEDLKTICENLLNKIKDKPDSEGDSLTSSLMKGINTAIGTATETIGLNVGKSVGQSMSKEIIPVLKGKGLSLIGI
jgi:hypothetical protein